MYTLKIKDKDNNYINEITNHGGFDYNWELNREGGCNITTNIDFLSKFDMATLYPLKSYIDIFRYERKLWSGVLVNIPGEVGAETGNMTLNFKGYLWLLKKMFINQLGRIFTMTDQGSIIWGLIYDFQQLPNGDYGITFGSINTDLLRDRTYKAFKNIYEVAIELTEVINGCDIEINEGKVLNVYAHKGRKINHVFEYGKNIADFSFSINGNDVVNNCYAAGSGEGEDFLYSSAHNMQSQEEYGLMQGVVQKSDVVLIDTLTESAQSIVDSYKGPDLMFNLESIMTNDPPLRGYAVGDEVKVIVNKGWFNVNTFKRIKKINVEVDTEEKEGISVEFL